MILLLKQFAGRRDMLFQAENYVCYSIYDARFPEGKSGRGKYAARYLASFIPKLENGLFGLSDGTTVQEHNCSCIPFCCLNNLH